VCVCVCVRARARAHTHTHTHAHIGRKFAPLCVLCSVQVNQVLKKLKSNEVLLTLSVNFTVYVLAP